MARRAHIGGGMAALALLLAPGTAGAAPSCEFPKAWSTANAQLGYQLTVEAALTDIHTRDLLARPLSSGSLTTYAGQRVTSAGYVGTALQQYATAVSGGTLSDPPSCSL